MNILIIGSGGREHAIAWKISQSDNVKKMFCAPGNPGMTQIAENIDIDVNNIDGLFSFAQKNKIDLTIVGPEDPLVNGIVNMFSSAGLKIFGPKQSAAQLEGSKSFAKNSPSLLGYLISGVPLDANACLTTSTSCITSIPAPTPISTLLNAVTDSSDLSE